MNIVHLEGTAWLAYENSKGILIDAGAHPDGRTIINRIRSLGIEITLLFLTHTHYDHTGGAESIRLATGAKVMVGKEEAEALRNGHTSVPAGTGRLGKAMLKLANIFGSSSRDYYQPVTENIVEITESGSLMELDSDVSVYKLGAHTAGSMGMRIGNDFFAGDTVFGFGPAIYPPFADIPEDFQSAWSVILGSGAKRVYPGHGRPFNIDRLKKQYYLRYGDK